MSIKNLMANTNAVQMRFWGKIFTSGDRNYYIAEGILEGAP